MFDSESSSEKPESLNIEVLFEKELESSEDPPEDEWSSLKLEVSEVNIKKLNYSLGLYDPGSREICAKYIPQSASSVLRHVYYNYPGITDPGIKEALLHPPPKVIYASDGRELYLALCEEMGLVPIRSFYKQLLEEEINLRYYGINPAAFRAIAMSLKLNKLVKVLDLTDNWIGRDGCFHLGEMLISNRFLTELNLTGCRIGPEGAEHLFFNLPKNRSLKKLNVSKNQLTDAGVDILAKTILKGCSVVNINLSYNSLTEKSVITLCDAFETHNKLTHLDLSWNTITSPKAVLNLCTHLSENKHFEELNLAWNALSGIGNAIKMLLTSNSIRNIYLNNNKLTGAAIKAIGVNLKLAKHLETLDLSCNPMQPADALKLLLQLTNRTVKVQRLLLDDVIVDTDFMKARKDILKMKSRKNTVITYGYVRTPFTPHLHDMRELMFNRADAVWQKQKRSANIALIILELYKIDPQPLDVKMFYRTVRQMGSLLNEDFIMGLCDLFPGPRIDKSKTVNLEALVDYVQRKWPDLKLPPTPPEPVILEIPKAKGKKK